MEPLKAELLSTAKWRVLAIPFGGPKDGKDLDGEYFSPRTDIKADWFSTRPVLWHHGMDAMLKDTNLGIEDELEVKEDGWWGTVWLNRANRYWEQIDKWLAKGIIYGSSGAIGHLVRKAKDGEILTWPHGEQTFTLMPINFLSRVEPTKAYDHFKSAGIAFPDLGLDLPEGGDDSAMERQRRAARAALLARIKTIT